MNLNRDTKYRRQQINWNIVFEYVNSPALNQNSESTHTDDTTTTMIENDDDKIDRISYYKANSRLSKIKRIKVQRLIEEIPTVEQLKKSSYDIYRNILCPFCKVKKETFEHVWICRYNQKCMKTIIERTKSKLLDIYT